MKSDKFTEEEKKKKKKTIISMVKSIDDEQDTEIMYFFGQELTENNIELEKYIEIVQKVKKEDIINIANKININVIYFLKD